MRWIRRHGSRFRRGWAAELHRSAIFLRRDTEVVIHRRIHAAQLIQVRAQGWLEGEAVSAWTIAPPAKNIPMVWSNRRFTFGSVQLSH